LASVGKQNGRRADDHDHPLRVDQGYLRNGSPREKAHVHPEGCYPDQAIELVTGTTVTAIEPARSRIAIDDGRELVHDRLLPTTGAAPRPMPLPGADPTGVHYIAHAR
jgi:3-phenylpropionate/trans-cinnamate dioxygenase ferredoxin reductase component